MRAHKDWSNSGAPQQMAPCESPQHKQPAVWFSSRPSWGCNMNLSPLCEAPERAGQHLHYYKC